MYDKGKIVTGIVIFVLLFAFPFWYRMGEPPRCRSRN